MKTRSFVEAILASNAFVAGPICAAILIRANRDLNRLSIGEENKPVDMVA
jgi:hypothetical protein